jgi:hypothetical protein
MMPLLIREPSAAPSRTIRQAPATHQKDGGRPIPATHLTDCAVWNNAPRRFSLGKSSLLKPSRGCSSHSL